jgi:hypothetical protein
MFLSIFIFRESDTVKLQIRHTRVGNGYYFEESKPVTSCKIGKGGGVLPPSPYDFGAKSYGQSDTT